MMPGAIIGPLLEDKPVTQFDPTKVNYIGTADSGVRVCATFQKSKIKSFADAQKSKAILGASSAGGATRDYAYLHNHTAGTKFDVVTGYKGTVDIALAMERGEVDGLCGWDWSSVKSQKREWVARQEAQHPGAGRPRSAAGADRHGRPADLEIRQRTRTTARSPSWSISQQVFQRSYIVPPGTPPSRSRSCARRSTRR